MMTSSQACSSILSLIQSSHILFLLFLFSQQVKIDETLIAPDMPWKSFDDIPSGFYYTADIINDIYLGHF